MNVLPPKYCSLAFNFFLNRIQNIKRSDPDQLQFIATSALGFMQDCAQAYSEEDWIKKLSHPAVAPYLLSHFDIDVPGLGNLYGVHVAPEAVCKPRVSSFTSKIPDKTDTQRGGVEGIECKQFITLAYHEVRNKVRVVYDLCIIRLALCG